MLDQIIELARTTNYDFRVTACPDDPLKHLFGEWVEYYRLKWAIARALQPRSILEIGVRYGYSAAAFLNACPRGHYLGIDLDSNTYGGVQGAIRWAQEITRGFNAEFIVADTQPMTCFPGGIYDLIHVDGQQDGGGSWHDLEAAIKQAHWVLVDGYFWTDLNFLSTSHFLYRYRDVLQSYCVIPGYAGELLIQVSPQYLASSAPTKTATESTQIRGAYTSSYYLEDCGGFDTYKENSGKQLGDARLKSVATIASLKHPRRVLDLGCGRGELSYFFARQGAQVTAVDYSEAAIQLAEKTFKGESNVRDKVELICGDVCTVPMVGKYDVVLASDLIEHLSPVELEVLYERIANHLVDNGLFVVHTYPNLWYFQYDYPRRRRIAASVGAYLPAEARTRYELLMHINEQSPRVLRKTLARHFSHVLLWFGEPEKPVQSLLQRLTIRELAEARDLYAVASHSPIKTQEITRRFQCLPLTPQGLEDVKLTVQKTASHVRVSSQFYPALEVANGSQHVLVSALPNPLHISYHWLNERAQSPVVFDGERTGIAPPLEPGEKREVAMKVKAPDLPGHYILRITLVQESVRWFDELVPPVKCDVPISVEPDLRLAPR